MLFGIHKYCRQKGLNHHMGFPDDFCFACWSTLLKVRSFVVDTLLCTPACGVCVIAHVPAGVSGCSDDFVVRAARTCLQDDISPLPCLMLWSPLCARVRV